MANTAAVEVYGPLAPVAAALSELDGVTIVRVEDDTTVAEVGGDTLWFGYEEPEESTLIVVGGESPDARASWLFEELAARVPFALVARRAATMAVFLSRPAPAAA